MKGSFALFVSNLLFLAGAVLFVPGSPPGCRDEETSKKAGIFLQRAVDSMTKLKGYRFISEILGYGDEGRKNIVFVPRFFLQPIGKEITGFAYMNGLVTFTMDGTEKGAFRNGIFLYEEVNQRWKLRYGKGPAGEPLWWIPDLNRILKEISRGYESIRIAKSEVLDNRPLRVIEILLSKDKAREMLLSNLLPDPTMVPASSHVNIVVFGPNGRSPNPKDLKYKIRIWLEPATGLVHRIEVTGTCRAAGQGKPFGMVVRIKGKQNQKDGKNKKKKKKEHKVRLVITIKEHGEVPYPMVPPGESSPGTPPIQWGTEMMPTPQPEAAH